MPKEVGQRARKNHLLKYYNEHFASEEVEMLEDLSAEDFPSLKFQTKSRIITLTTNSFGEVSEDFRMRRGAGSKQDFLNKQTAYIALNTYLKLHFPEDVMIQTNSFEESMIKIQTDTQIIRLLYDFTKQEVYEKTRNRRGVNTKEPVLENELSEKKTVDTKKAKKDEIEVEVVENNQKENIDHTKDISVKESKRKTSTKSNKYIEEEDITKLIKERKVKQARHKKLEEGVKVKNLYNEMVYTVLDDDFGMLRVVDQNKITYLMTISDIEVIS